VILDSHPRSAGPVTVCLDTTQVLELQQLVRRVPVSQHVALYALTLFRATRQLEAPDFVNRWVNWGAGPRAGQLSSARRKTHVLLQGVSASPAPM